MKKLLLLLTLNFLLNTLFAQTQKRHWIAGGTGLFHSKTTRSLRTDAAILDVGIRRTNLNLSPDLGYCLTDQLVAGIRLLYAANRSKVLYGTDLPFGGSNYYGAGPFLRYYLLPGKKKFNLLVDGSYQFGSQKRDEYIFMDGRPFASYKINRRGHIASISAGPVFNVSSKLGVELLAAYTSANYLSMYGKSRMVMAGVGLHVYL